MTDAQRRRACLLAIVAGFGMLASSACVIGPKHDDPARDPGIVDTGLGSADTTSPADGAAFDAPVPSETADDSMGIGDNRCGDGGKDGGDAGDGGCEDAPDAPDAPDAGEVADSVTGG